MNRSKTLLILSGAIPSVALAIIFMVATIPPGPDLVAHWKFDEGKDLITGDSINKNMGTLVNGPIWLTSAKQCVEKGCLNLDGVNDYVIVPRSSSIEPKNAITISMWVNAVIPRGSLVDKAYTTHSSPFYSYNLQLEPKTGQPDKAEMIWSVNTRGVLTSMGEGTSEVLIDLNSWQFVTVVYDGAEMREYVNGQLIASTSKTGTIPFYNMPLMIGTYSNYEFFTNAIIDDLRIYGNALTDDQIQQLYKEGSPPGPRPMSVLLSYWGFDEGADVAADDKTGNGNRGTLMGNPTWLSSTQCVTGSSCLEFDGVDDVVAIRSSPTLNFNSSTSFSMSLWLKSTQSGGGDVGFGWLVDHRRNNDGVYAGYSIGDSSGTIVARIRDSGGNDVQVSSTRNVNDGKWHHVVYVVDRYAQQARLYIDNTLESNADISSVGTIETSVDLNLAGTAAPNTGINFFRGTLDQIRIYSGAISDTMIRELYEELEHSMPASLDGPWQYREHKSSEYSPDFVFTKETGGNERLEIQSQGRESIGIANVFKVFKKSDILNREIRVTWERTMDGPGASRASIAVYDGQYDRASSSDFPDGSATLVKGGSSLGRFEINWTKGWDERTDVLTSDNIDYTISRSEYATVLLWTGDSHYSTNQHLQIRSIEIVGYAKWIFEDPIIISEKSASTGDYGTIQASSVIA